jgi:hypothetical protein
MSAQQVYVLAGCINKVTQTKYSDPGQFSVITVDGTIYNCICPFFKPVQEGDCIHGQVTPDQYGNLTFIFEPFVEIPIDSDNIKKCFITALRTSGFGRDSSEKLYTKVAEMTKINLQMKSIPKKCEVSPEVLNLPDIKSEIPGIPDIGVFTPEIEDGETVTSSNIINYLNESAIAFVEKREKVFAEVLSSSMKMPLKIVEKLLYWWYTSRAMRCLYLLGLTKKEILDCNKPHDIIYKICTGPKANPFKLPAIPMEKCHTIMKFQGLEPTETQVNCGTIIRKIYEFTTTRGWTCTPMWLLLKSFSDFHSYEEPLIKEYGVVLDNDSAYLRYQYDVEVEVANYLDKLIKRTSDRLNSLPQFDTPKVETAYYKRKTLDVEQKLAIQGALEHEISIITGGPGTGKSTIIGEIVNNLQLREIPFAVTSFTGCAVSRIQDILTVKCAATLDRMIAQGNVAPFVYLIIDESSMVTTEKFYQFITRYPTKFRIIFVGDKDQLQPISWGTLFSQIMNSNRIPTYRLVNNHRIVRHIKTAADLEASKVEEASAPAAADFDRVILENANALIRPGRNYDEPVMFRDGDGFSSMDGTINTIQAILVGLKKAGVTKEAITILCPYTKHLSDLNKVFQDIYLPKASQMCDAEGKVWKIGDRVMMIVNNYDINIMNGENGTVVGFIESGITVKFKDGIAHDFKFPPPGYKLEFRRKRQVQSEVGEALHRNEDDDTALTTDYLIHSSSITVHKSQGSEQQYIIFYIPSEYNQYGGISKFLNVNLLFTGITRAKRFVWMIGNPGFIGQITTQLPSKRYEFLRLRLKNLGDVEAEAKILAIVDSQYDKYKNALTPEEEEQPDFIPDDEDNFMPASYFG